MSTNTVPSSATNLARKCVGDLSGTFFVPAYQRGYRWNTTDVEHLLEDIWSTEGKDYSLQPVVVKLRKPGEEETRHEWELIDGQQRLTTLYLIFRYMCREKLQSLEAPYTLRYETRHHSKAYLQTLDPDEHNANIDYFHLYNAYQFIAEWFARHGPRRQHVANKFYGYLFDSVKIIWYEAPTRPGLTELESTNESIALFTRLNVGRIPLTDAELIKALLLSAARRNSADRAQELAAQWYGIEQDLHDPQVWAFVAGPSAAANPEHYPTRISLLLDTLADAQQPPSGKRLPYHTFDTLRPGIEADSEARTSTFWDQVIALHARILGWFDDPRLYNKIGFLIATGTPFGDLVALATGRRKSTFEQSLITHIRTGLSLSPTAILDLSYEDKRNGYPKLFRLLLLMNVETLSRTGQRFPFWRHAGKEWSLEHIHAQNAEALATTEQWTTWLTEHRQALLTLPLEDAGREAARDTLIQDIEAVRGRIDRDTFRSLSDRVMAMFAPVDARSASPDEDLHSIRNLALIASRDNTRLSNAVFEVKRRILLETDRAGGYIPICTRNVFLKYYTAAQAQQLHYWSETDRENYYQALLTTLADYLESEPLAPVTTP